MRATILALLAGLTAPVAAAANWPTTDEGKLGRSLPIAHAAWPQSPCAGREVVRLGDDAEIAVMSDRGLGFADPAACVVGIASGLDAYSFCVVLVHELGHLAGREHSGDPRSVMFATPGTYPPCRRAFRDPPPIEQAKQLIREGFLPAPRARWQIACTPARARRATCAARAPTARHARSFVVTIRGGNLAVDAR